MKNIFTFLIIVFAMNTNAQKINKIKQDTTKKQEILINSCTRAGLKDFKNFKDSYQKNYESYQLNDSVVKQLSNLPKPNKIKIILGTWCDDSKYHVPHFFKIIDALKIDKKAIEIIAVDGKKKTENDAIDKLKIVSVPTFIFFDDRGVDLGRITEHPKTTLEQDMFRILLPKETKNQ